jgi:hypothetical protein
LAPAQGLFRGLELKMPPRLTIPGQLLVVMNCGLTLKRVAQLAAS